MGLPLLLSVGVFFVKVGFFPFLNPRGYCFAEV